MLKEAGWEGAFAAHEARLTHIGDDINVIPQIFIAQEGDKMRKGSSKKKLYPGEPNFAY